MLPNPSTGFLYYHCSKDVAKRLRDFQEFKDFLDVDASSDNIIKNQGNSLKELRDMRRLARNSFYHKLSRDRQIMACVSSMRVELLEKIISFRNLLFQKIKCVRSQHDVVIVKNLVTYFGVLEADMNNLRVRRLEENKVFDVYLQQAKLAHSLKLFSYHVRVETKEQVTLEFLDKDTAQYKRCRQAVKENISVRTIKDAGFEGINILRVIRLHHRVLEGSFQSQVSCSPEAKVRGLFSCVSQTQIYALTMFGVHAQDTSHRPTSTSPAPLLPGLIQASWFSLPMPSTNYADSSQARRHLGDPTRSGGGGGGGGPISNSGLALRMALEQTPFPPLRFCKCSTPASLGGFSEAELAQGTYLALCRVAMLRVLQTDEAVSEAGVRVALEQGYDTLHSTLTDEFVSLDPSNVLPEFIILIQLTRPNNAASTAHSATTLHNQTAPLSERRSALPGFLQDEVPPNNSSSHVLCHRLGPSHLEPASIHGPLLFRESEAEVLRWNQSRSLSVAATAAWSPLPEGGGAGVPKDDGITAGDGVRSEESASVVSTNLAAQRKTLHLAVEALLDDFSRSVTGFFREFILQIRGLRTL